MYAEFSIGNMLPIVTTSDPIRKGEIFTIDAPPKLDWEEECFLHDFDGYI